MARARRGDPRRRPHVAAVAGRGDVHRRDRRRAGPARRRRPDRAGDRRRPSRRHRRLRHLRPGAGRPRLAPGPPAVRRRAVGHRRHARRQRPRLRAPGRQDRRSPLHRLSVLLERRRGLPDRAAAGAAGRGRHPAPARRARLRADPLRLPVADRDPASAHGVARRVVGRRVPRADLAAARSAGLAGVGGVDLPGLLRRAVAVADCPAQRWSSDPPPYAESADRTSTSDGLAPETALHRTARSNVTSFPPREWARPAR